MAEKMLIEVTGPGCPFCNTLYRRVREVVMEKGIEADVEHIAQLRIVMKHLPFIPVLKVGGEVVHRGKWLPNKEKIYTLIKREKPA